MNAGKNAAVILAAGVGSRFGGEVPKQRRTLGTQSVLYYTLRAFDRVEEISFLQLVVRAEDVPFAEKLADALSTPTGVCVGGADRQASSRIGVAALPPDVTTVAIHDAARCLVTPEVIRKTLRAAEQYGAAMAAAAVVDTVKRTDADGRVLATVPREELCLAQTPQVMRRDLYERAAEVAERTGLCVTDDAALLQACDIPVYAVLHTEQNPKITYPEDLSLAEFVLSQRGELV